MQKHAVRRTQLGYGCGSIPLFEEAEHKPLRSFVNAQSLCSLLIFFTFSNGEWRVWGALMRTTDTAQGSAAGWALGTTVWQTTHYTSVVGPEDSLAEWGSCSVVCLGLDQIAGLGDKRQMSCARGSKPYCPSEPMLCRQYSCSSRFQLQFPPSVQSVPRVFPVGGYKKSALSDAPRQD